MSKRGTQEVNTHRALQVGEGVTTVIISIQPVIVMGVTAIRTSMVTMIMAIRGILISTIRDRRLPLTFTTHLDGDFEQFLILFS